MPSKDVHDDGAVDGERLIMAEQTTINARNQPDVHRRARLKVEHSWQSSEST
jgi:hypothetical protein